MKLHLPLALFVSLLASWVAVTRSETLTWNAGSGVWSDSSAAEWTPNTAAPAGKDVVFTEAGQGTVSVDGSVTPVSVAVQGGVYVFEQQGGTSGGIVTGGAFSIDGAGTRLTLAAANPGLTGEVALGGGALVLGAENAIGAATLLFNGGALVYGEGVTQDVSAQVGTASTSVVRVDTAGNDVTWGNRSTADIPGFVASLRNGIEKSGSGTLTLLEIQGGAGTYGGAISVLGGRLNIYADYATGAAGSSAAILLNGDISVAAGAWLSLGTTFDSSNSIRMKLAGNLSGAGTVEVGNPENYHTGAENKAGGGRYAISGDNRSFAGALRLSGLAASDTLLYNGTEFATDASLGGSQSTLQLNGRQFWILETRSVHDLPMAVVLVEGSHTVFHPNNNQTYHFSGVLSGGGTLSGLDGRSATVRFSGDVSACSGTLNSGSGNVFLLGGEGAVSPGGEMVMTLGGSGSFVVAYEQAATLAGAVQGTASLRQSGAGVLTLTGANTTTGSLTVDAGCTLNIGSASTAGTWAGDTAAGGGSLVLVNGGLAAALAAPAPEVVVNAAAGATVTAGGTAGSYIRSITLPAGSVLTGVSGDLATGTGGVRVLDFTLDSANVGEGAAAAAKIDQGGGTLTVTGGSGAQITLSPDSLVGTLIAHWRDGVESYLTLTTGSLVVEDLADIAVSPLLDAYGLRIVRAEGGSLVVSGQTQGLYYVTGDTATTYPHEVTEYPTLGLYAGVIVEQGQTLTVALPGAPQDPLLPAYVNNLSGGSGSKLSVENTGSGTAVLVLHNSLTDTQLPDPTTVGADTETAGAIFAGNGVQLVKSGAGTLTVSGGFQAGMLRLDDGTLCLGGTAENRIAVLTDSANGGTLRLAAGTELRLTRKSALSLSRLEGPGTLDLAGSLSLGGAASLQGLALRLEDAGVLELGGTGGHSLSVLGGGGTLSAAGSSLRITGTGGVFTGSLGGSGSNLLTVEEGASLTLRRVGGNRAWSVANHGALVLDVAGDTANKSLTLGTLSLGGGSVTTLVLNTDVATASAYLLSGLDADGNAAVILKSTGQYGIELDAGGRRVIGRVEEAARSRAQVSIPLELEGYAAFRRIASAVLTVEDNLLIFNGTIVEYNRYAAVADTPNALAGATLMWELPDRVAVAYPGLRSLDEALFDLVAQNRRSEANALMVAVSGAAATVQGAAFAGDMERQLRAMRNRTAAMGLPPCQEYEDLPYTHFWVNAESHFYRREAEGADCGYSFNNWGGTVGADFDFSGKFTLAAAFTAMFGDLSARGTACADSKGHIDTYYASLMARYADHEWVQQLVVSFGWAQSSFHRQTGYAGGSFRASGDTDGFAFGMLYEVAYNIALDEDKRTLLQPLANVSFIHSSIGGYSEHGADAALRFGDQTQSFCEFGVGARLCTPVAETLFNRSVQSEWRVVAKLAAGDRRSETEASFVAFPGNSASIRSATRERFGVELGAGLAVPVGPDSETLFLDASALLRSKTTDFNIIVGYRMDF